MRRRAAPATDVRCKAASQVGPLDRARPRRSVATHKTLCMHGTACRWRSARRAAQQHRRRLHSEHGAATAHRAGRARTSAHTAAAALPPLLPTIWGPRMLVSYAALAGGGRRQRRRRRGADPAQGRDPAVPLPGPVCVRRQDTPQEGAATRRGVSLDRARVRSAAGPASHRAEAVPVLEGDLACWPCIGLHARAAEWSWMEHSTVCLKPLAATSTA
eukprot:362377-Chlamydomonas_euryale.AAC.1